MLIADWLQMLPTTMTHLKKKFFLKKEKKKPQERLWDSPPENLGGEKMRAGKEWLLLSRILSFTLKGEKCPRAPHHHGHRHKTEI